jgi:transcriptional regulator with XRE-family HTH domain
MNLKKQLKLYLANKGLTASELSRISGVPKQSLSDWLAGSSPRDIRTVKKVADALEVTLDHLVFGDGVAVLQESVPANEWMSGIYEVKFRKIKV